MLTGTDFTVPMRGADLGGFSSDQLYSTASYQAGDLTGIRLIENNLSGWNFAGQNLTNAISRRHADGRRLYRCRNTRGKLGKATGQCTGGGACSYIGTGITVAQLHSTASYQAKDLRGMGLALSNLAGANFTGQNLTTANFYGATLTNADLSAADVSSGTVYRRRI